MKSSAVYREEAEEIELRVLGAENTLARAKDGSVKWPAEWIERNERRLGVLRGAHETLLFAAEKARERETSGGNA